MSQWVSCGHGHRHWGARGAAGLLLRANGCALLQRRAAWTDHGGTWGILGGACEFGEDPTTTALREAVEESGLDVTKVHITGTTARDCGGWVYTTVLAVAYSLLGFRDSAEGNLRWVPAGEVSRLPLHPGFSATWHTGAPA